MKALISLISICVIVFLLGVGCSKEEASQFPESGPRVVKPIIISPPEEIKNPITTDEKPAEPEVEKEIHAIQVVSKEEAVKPLEPKPIKPLEESEDPSSFYLVKEGDNLSQISGRDDVYGSSLNWPILYRHNLDQLGDMKPGPNLPKTKIPQKTKLKIVTAEQAGENIKERANKTWVINIISTTTRGEIVAPAIMLMKEGYPVYVTNAKVKGREWMRLRVGFFQSKSEADAEGKKIGALLKFVKPWTTKIGENEHKTYAGY